MCWCPPHLGFRVSCPASLSMSGSVSLRLQRSLLGEAVFQWAHQCCHASSYFKVAQRGVNSSVVLAMSPATPVGAQFETETGTGTSSASSTKSLADCRALVGKVKKEGGSASSVSVKGGECRMTDCPEPKKTGSSCCGKHNATVRCMLRGAQAKDLQ
jgi:hypothetical protein